MSMDSSSLQARADKEGQPDPGGGSDRCERQPGIRRQAAAIIEAVLSGSNPEGAWARGQLRARLAAHPGRPEAALAEHLAALRPRTGLSPDTTVGVSEAGAPGIETPSVATSRVEAVLESRMLVTAFQPIRELSTGAVIGVEAFTRFVSDGSDTAGEWFAAAAEARLGSELDFAALECALAAAEHLPAHLYVALKLSPGTCLDPLLPELLRESTLPASRIVLQLTDALTPEQPAALVAALAPLRRKGIRLAVDHVGSHFDSIRHVRQLKPDIIKLDRNLIAGIDADALRHAFGEVMTGFAEQIGAAIIAEGIETGDELAAVAQLGVAAGQGYYFGRPSSSPLDWAGWSNPAEQYQPLAEADGIGS